MTYEDKLNKAIKELETFKIMAKSESGEMAITMAIEALKREPVNKLTQQAYEDGKKDGYFQAKADQILKTGWIPVSERLPDIHNYTKKYLVTNKYRDVYIAFFTETYGKSWWSFNNVVAWMPLPDAYLPETEEKRNENSY